MKILKGQDLNGEIYHLKCKHYKCNAEFEFEGWELKQEIDGNYYNYLFTCLFCKTENKYSGGLLEQYIVKTVTKEVKLMHKKKKEE